MFEFDLVAAAWDLDAGAGVFPLVLVVGLQLFPQIVDRHPNDGVFVGVEMSVAAKNVDGDVVLAGGVILDRGLDQVLQQLLVDS